MLIDGKEPACEKEEIDWRQRDVLMQVPCALAAATCSVVRELKMAIVAGGLQGELGRKRTMESG